MVKKSPIKNWQSGLRTRNNFEGWQDGIMEGWNNGVMEGWKFVNFNPQDKLSPRKTSRLRTTDLQLRTYQL